MQRIEVITGELKHRCYILEKKARFVTLTIQTGYNASLVARQYGVTHSFLFKRKRIMNDGGKSAIAARDEVVTVSEVKTLEKIQTAEQMLGRTMMEDEVARDTLEIAQAKILYRSCHCCHRTIPFI